MPCQSASFEQRRIQQTHCKGRLPPNAASPRAAEGHEILRRPGTQAFPICRVGDLLPGERKVVEVERRSIGVFNVHGEYYALRNLCPHQGAPLCRGIITGTNLPSQPGEYIWERDGEILRCPWHGWEFDITSGRSVFNPHRLRVRTYAVTVEPHVEEEDPSVEKFDVTVEEGWVVLHA